MEPRDIDGGAVPLLMGIKEASAFTRYSIKYLYKLTSERRIPHYKPQGGRLVFRRDELEDFMLRGRVETDYEMEAKAEAFLLSRKKK